MKTETPRWLPFSIECEETESQADLRNTEFRIRLAEAADMLDGMARILKPGEAVGTVARFEDTAAYLRNAAMLRPYGGRRLRLSKS